MTPANVKTLIRMFRVRQDRFNLSFPVIQGVPYKKGSFLLAIYSLSVKHFLFIFLFFCHFPSTGGLQKSF